jgi:glycerol kinase
MSVMLAIDQSTSATKAILFDTTGHLIAKQAINHQQYYPQQGWVEHNAEEIYQNTITVIGQVLAAHSELTSELLCLSITNQRETFVVFEKETGRPLYNAIVWQCRRGEPLCTHLINEGHSAKVQRITGLKIDTYFPAAKMTWLLTERPDLRQKLESGQALLGTIDTYLIYRLTNHQVFASDHTNACRTLLFDINAMVWSQQLCDLFDIPIHALPKVRESSAQFGETTVAGILKNPIPICGVMGDSQAALFAERCFEVGTAKVTFGTGSSVLLNIGNKIRFSPNGIVTTIGWVHQGRPTYAFEGIINFTGATIAWMRDQMQLIQSPEETEPLAVAVPDNGGVYLVPAFVGLSAPYWEPNAKAAIIGLTPTATKSHIVRAALESIAYQVKDVLDLMTNDAGITLQQIQGDGGMVRNQFLMQFVADMIGYPVHASHVVELSALGAVMFGMLGMGFLDNFEVLSHHFTDYKPLIPAKKRQENYEGWKQAVEKVLR